MLQLGGPQGPGDTIQRVLVVDDDETTRMICCATLEGCGFEVFEADDGQSGLEEFQRAHPDIVLLDLEMPHVDGFELCRRLRTLPQAQHIPLVIMTGLEDLESIQKAYDSGATDFVTKPLNFHILPHRVRYILRNKSISDQLRESERRLSDAYRVARLGYWEWDSAKDSVYFSVEGLKIFGLDESDRWISIEKLAQRIDRRDKRRFLATLEDMRKNGEDCSLEFRVPYKSGIERFVYQRTRVTGGTPGSDVQVVGAVQDITEQKLTEERIRYLAYFDNVTGLPNRTFIKELLQNAIENAAKNDWIAAVMFLDLDNFKRINDTLGHDAGDRLLRDVAQRLNDCLRNSDSVIYKQTMVRKKRVSSVGELCPSGKAVSRLGGDEFVILLNNLESTDEAGVVAQRVAQALSSTFLVGEAELKVSTSIGISTFPKDGRDVETLLKHADVAMYQAKERGKAGYHFYTRTISDQMERKFSIETDLRGAVGNGELVLNYQPKICLSSGRISGVEALIRWEHPEQGILPPADFIPVAEETGLILEIGNWAFRQACLDCRRLHEAGHDLSMAVNVSPAQFHQVDFVDKTRVLMEEEGVRPGWIDLELTEGLLVEDSQASIEKLGRVRELGVGVSIDDFGTGYSSLSYLKRFSLSSLKIDQSFVRDLTVDPNDAAIVEATIALAHSLDLHVIAEGVESRRQLQILQEHECDAAQGFLFSRPLVFKDLITWARQNELTDWLELVDA